MSVARQPATRNVALIVAVLVSACGSEDSQPKPIAQPIAKSPPAAPQATPAPATQKVEPPKMVRCPGCGSHVAKGALRPLLGLRIRGRVPNVCKRCLRMDRRVGDLGDAYVRSPATIAESHEEAVWIGDVCRMDAEVIG